MAGRRTRSASGGRSRRPVASGLASSAALELATAVALDALHGLRLPPQHLADLAHRAENDFVGVPCGIMDQYACALGREGAALLLHCAERRFEHVPLPASALVVAVLDTKTPRVLAASAYRDRVRECAEALAAITACVGARASLAACRPADLEAAAAALSPLQLRRARHVITEAARVGAAVEALRAGDFVALGRLVDASHRSGQVDHEVTCAELDAITASARAVAGVFGARYVGAGFGGCAIALVRPDRVAALEQRVAADFTARFGVVPGFYAVRAGGGPRELAG